MPQTPRPLSHQPLPRRTILRGGLAGAAGNGQRVQIGWRPEHCLVLA